MSDANRQAVDIGRRQIASVYAKALLGAAEQNRSTQDVLDQLDGFVRKVLNSQPKFQGLLESPRVSTAEKIHLLDESLTGHVSETLLRFLKVVAEHERLDCLNDIYVETRRQFNDRQGIVQIHITTAQHIEPEVIDKIRAALMAKFNAQLDIETSVDSQLIGGVVVRIGDKLYDGSVAQKLKSLRDEALQNTVKKIREATDTFATSG